MIGVTSWILGCGTAGPRKTLLCASFDQQQQRSTFGGDDVPCCSDKVGDPHQDREQQRRVCGAVIITVELGQHHGMIGKYNRFRID